MGLYVCKYNDNKSKMESEAHLKGSLISSKRVKFSLLCFLAPSNLNNNNNSSSNNNNNKNNYLVHLQYRGTVPSLHWVKFALGQIYRRTLIVCEHIGNTTDCIQVIIDRQSEELYLLIFGRPQNSGKMWAKFVDIRAQFGWKGAQIRAKKTCAPIPNEIDTFMVTSVFNSKEGHKFKTCGNRLSFFNGRIQRINHLFTLLN